MKAFIHNFRKFYKEKTKIKNLLSAPAAKQRNISLKIYHKNYLVFYCISIAEYLPGGEVDAGLNTPSRTKLHEVI